MPSRPGSQNEGRFTHHDPAEVEVRELRRSVRAHVDARLTELHGQRGLHSFPLGFDSSAVVSSTLGPVRSQTVPALTWLRGTVGPQALLQLPRSGRSRVRRARYAHSGLTFPAGPDEPSLPMSPGAGIRVTPLPWASSTSRTDS